MYINSICRATNLTYMKLPWSIQGAVVFYLLKAKENTDVVNESCKNCLKSDGLGSKALGGTYLVLGAIGPRSVFKGG
jgi:hypothetical protein